MLKRAYAFERRAEILDRSAYGQHYHVDCLNLVPAAFIHWNTRLLSQIAAKRTVANHLP